MSETTTPVVPTALQPPLHPSNILAHPGSSFAAGGLIMAAVAQQMNAGAMPTTLLGWVTLVAECALAVAAALGK